MVNRDCVDRVHVARYQEEYLFYLRFAVIEVNGLGRYRMTIGSIPFEQIVET